MVLLVVGNLDTAEFHEARTILAATGTAIEVPSVEAACEFLSGTAHAIDVIVVAEHYPGQHAPEAIDRLRQWAPLARIVRLLGSWCEGEGRTGRPWPGAIRIYWHQWVAQLAREAASLPTGGGSWGLPATASEEERLLAVFKSRFRSAPAGWPSAGGEFAMQEWLCDACRRAGYTAIGMRPGGQWAAGPFTAAIFDADGFRDEQHEELRRFAAAVHPAPVVALLGFPRIEDCARAKSAGAAAVLSKPLLLEDLYWQLQGLDQGPRPAQIDLNTAAVDHRHGVFIVPPQSAVDHRGFADFLDPPAFVDVPAEDQFRLHAVDILPDGGASGVGPEVGAIDFQAAGGTWAKRTSCTASWTAARPASRLPPVLLGQRVHSTLPRRNGRQPVNAHLAGKDPPAV